MRRPVSDATVRKWARECRRLFPTDQPVRVIRCRFPNKPGTRRPMWLGECRHTPRGVIEIRIDERIDRGSTADTLIHEWAHALRSEDETGDEASHDDNFWILFGSLYRTFFGTK